MSKGFGFVDFEDVNDFQSALNQANLMLGTIPITIGRARQSNKNNNNGLNNFSGNDPSGSRSFPTRRPY